MKTLANKPDANQIYSSDFDNIYPYSKMKRCLCNKTTGKIIKELNDNNSLQDLAGSPVDLTSNTYDVMVRIPAFYYKTTFLKDTTQYSILQDVPYEQFLGDHEVHPAFIREDGSIRPYVLIGAFKGSVLEGQLRSIINQKPQVSQTISWFRDSARQGRSTKYNIHTIHTVSAMQLLYLVEFNNTNSQAMLGNGWTGKSESATTGATVALGNKSGYLGVNGNQVSYRGIEDPFGNVWEFIDALLIKDDGFYMSKDPAKFGDIEQLTLTPVVPLTAPDNTKDGYIKSMFREKSLDFGFFPNTTGDDATNTAYWCDYHYTHRTGATNIALFGGPWNNGTNAGLFHWTWSSGVSTAGSSTGARLVFLP